MKSLIKIGNEYLSKLVVNYLEDGTDIEFISGDKFFAFKCDNNYAKRISSILENHNIENELEPINMSQNEEEETKRISKEDVVKGSRVVVSDKSWIFLDSEITDLIAKKESMRNSE
jgi:hypothetical protein